MESHRAKLRLIIEQLDEMIDDPNTGIVLSDDLSQLALKVKIILDALDDRLENDT